MKRQSSFAETADRLKKPRPQLLDKREAKAKVSAEDRAENAKVKRRSLGFCEVVEVLAVGSGRKKCYRRGAHIHHLKSGIGVRNVGESIKAICKLHVCEQHHEEIHGHVVRPTNYMDRYDARRILFIRAR